mgnify:CR=1 FL=1
MSLPRAFWSGDLIWGASKFPVKIYSTTKKVESNVSLRHITDNGEVGYQPYCKLDGSVLKADEIIKMKNIDGKLTTLPPEKENPKMFAIIGTSSLPDIITIKKTYLIVPQEHTTEFAVIYKALRQMKLALTAILINLGKERQVTIIPDDFKLIMIEQHSEAERVPLDVPSLTAKVTKIQLNTMKNIVEATSLNRQPEALKTIEERA